MKKSQKEALDAGETTYFTGKECIRGHISKRSTISGSCNDCLSFTQKKRRQAMQKKLKENARKRII